MLISRSFLIITNYILSNIHVRGIHENQLNHNAIEEPCFVIFAIFAKYFLSREIKYCCVSSLFLKVGIVLDSFNGALRDVLTR